MKIYHFSISPINDLIGTRASYFISTKTLAIYLDNIWRDTLNFSKFVEGLNIIYLLEFSCVIYHNADKKDNFLYQDEMYCYKHKKKGNECVFFQVAKAIYNSDYYIKSSPEVEN